MNLRTRRRTYSIGAAILTALVLVGAASSPAIAYQSPFTFTLMGDTQVTQWNNVDEQPAMFNDGGDIYMVYAATGYDWQVWKGPDMDNMSYQSTFCADCYFPRPHGNDLHWISGGYVDPVTGTWYGTVHTEFNYVTAGGIESHFRSVGVASSTNKGYSWNYMGDILTSPNPVSTGAYGTAAYDFGVGDETIVVDQAGGYVYLFWPKVWESQSRNSGPNWQYFSTRVSRAPLSSNMEPGTWSNFYQGGWSEPGLGGLSSDIGFSNTSTVSVHWNTYLNKWVGIGCSYVNGAPPRYGVISTATSLETMNWTSLDLLTSNPAQVQFYQWPWNTGSETTMTMGQTFRLYGASNNSTAPSQYTNITLGSGTSAGWTAPAQAYPGTSVRDGNSGWQTASAPSTPSISSISQSSGVVSLAWNSISGATDYKVEYGTTPGRYTRSVDVTTNSASITVPPGATYYFKVRAATATAFGALSGEQSIYVTGTNKYNDTASSVAYSGSGWFTAGSRPNEYQSDLHGTANSGDSATFTFTGSGASYIGTKANDHGDVEIYLDGVSQGIVSTYNSTTASQQTLYTATNLVYGQHTLTVTKRSDATKYMDVDAFTEIVDAASASRTLKLTSVNSGLVADVSGGSTTAGAAVLQWNSNGGNNQKWVVKPVGNGYVKLLNLNSGLALDTAGGSGSAGTQVVQNVDNGAYSQQWKLVATPTGYSIQARGSRLYLDVSGASTSPGAALTIWTNTGGSNQRWLVAP